MREQDMHAFNLLCATSMGTTCTPVSSVIARERYEKDVGGVLGKFLGFWSNYGRCKAKVENTKGDKVLME